MNKSGFNNILKLRRLQLGMTQEALAELCGTSYTSVQRWEQGGKPNYETFFKIARALRLLPEELAGIAPIEISPDQITPQQALDVIQDMVQSHQDLLTDLEIINEAGMMKNYHSLLDQAKKQLRE